MPLQARSWRLRPGRLSRGLDELRAWRDESRQKIAALRPITRCFGNFLAEDQAQQRLGYYIECRPNRPSAWASLFIHRQTIASSVRYATVELGELEDRIRSAATRPGAGAGTGSPI